MVEKSEGALAEYDFEPIAITLEDFEDVPQADGGAVDVPEGEVTDVARAEVGDSGQLGSYDIVRLGQSLDAGNQDSPKGKIFMDGREGDDTEIDERTQFRFVVQPKNQNRTVPLTSWISLRDLNTERPDHRIPLTPVTRGGKPAFAKDGRFLTLQARNSATGVEFSRENSDADVPARAGY